MRKFSLEGLKSVLLIFAVTLVGLPLPASGQSDLKRSLENVKKVVFLGDSITYGGQYVAQIEFILRNNDISDIEFLNLGLPSETVSGLSEPGHAGGRFPRPDLHERLSRLFPAIEPDLIVANYGMNCGIYHPYSDERFDAFRNGMTKLHEQAKEAGAKIIHVTPPGFDPNPIRERLLPAGEDEYRKGYVGYDEVLTLYSSWLLAKQGEGWMVIDAHGPMKDYLEAKRQNDPEFRLAKDGVHINTQGHYLIAREIANALGIQDKRVDNPEFGAFKEAYGNSGIDCLGLIKQRQKIKSDYWLNKVGHERPGMKGPVTAKMLELEVKRLTDMIEAIDK